MATNQPSEASQTISEVSKQEGGTFKGSTSAQMQSQATKQRNLEDAAATIGSKLESDPSSITKSDAQLLHRSEARAGEGPTSGDLASQAQSVAAANERGDTVQSNAPASNVTPGQQSQMDREENYKQAADEVGSKMQQEPGSVTKEDGDLLHSRETRAFGGTEKGGLASQAQSLASENAGDKKTS
ncbi:hypothetical protein ACLMJK_004632 [Lecanora helva]